MSHRNTKSNEDAVDSGAAAEQNENATGQGAELVAGEHAYHLDLEAGPVLAEFLSQDASPNTSGDDLHAAVSALGDDIVDQLDPAAQHLIDSVDLFDVPTDDTGDAA